MGGPTTTVDKPSFTLEQLRRKRGRYEEVNGVVCKWCQDCKTFIPVDQFDYKPSLGRHDAYCQEHQAKRAAHANTPEGQAETAYWSEVGKRRRARLAEGHVPKPRKRSCHQLVNGEIHKTCTACEKLLPLDCFAKHGKTLRSQCEECRALKGKQYREKNRTAIKERRAREYHRHSAAAVRRAREWREANPEKAKETERRYRQVNREKLLAQKREYAARPEVKEAQRRYAKENRAHLATLNKKRHQERIREDIQYRLKVRFKARLSSYFSKQRSRKRYRSIELLGCTIAELKAHLESLWLPGMNWDNYGRYDLGNPMTWHIDHIKPVSSFDLTDPKQQKACFCWRNLQPLWAVDNIVKGDKLDWKPTHA